MEERNWKDAVKYLKVAVAGTIMASVGTAYTFDTVHADEIATDAKVEQLFSGYSVLSDSAFKDVQADFWAADSIKWAANAGIIDGYSDGTFRPNDVLTEGQFSTMLSRFYTDLGNQKSVDGAYLGLAKYRVPLMGYVDDYYKSKPVTRGLIAQAIAHVQGQDASLDNAVYYMFESGITVGKVVDGTMVYEEFGRTEHVTRAEAVMIFHRMNGMGKTQVADSVKANKVEDVKAGAQAAVKIVDTRVIEKKPVEKPAAKPVVSAPVVKPAVAKPAPKPVVTKTVAKPVVKKVVAKPVLQKKAAVKTPAKKVTTAKKTVSTTKYFASKKFVTTTTVSVLSSASTKGKVLTKIPRSKIVSSNKSVSGWYQVTYNGKTGYVSGKYLKAYVAPKTTKFKAKKYVTKDNLSLRKSYSVSSTKLTTIPRNKVVVSGETYKGWYKVTYAGKTGWVSGSYLKAYVAPKPKPTPKPTPKPSTPKPSESRYASLVTPIYDQYGIEISTTKYGSFFTLSNEYSHAYSADSNRLIISKSFDSKDETSLRIASKVVAKLTGDSDSEGIYRAIKNSSTSKLTTYKGIRISNSGNALSVYF